MRIVKDRVTVTYQSFPLTKEDTYPGHTSFIVGVERGETGHWEVLPYGECETFFEEGSLVRASFCEVFLGKISTGKVVIRLSNQGNVIEVKGFGKRGYLKTTGEILEYNIQSGMYAENRYIKEKRQEKLKEVEEIKLGARKILKEVEDEPA